MSTTKFDSDSLQSQISLLQKENEKSKDEVKEVLQALEELAMNYDQKLQEVDNKNRENDKLVEDLSSKQVGDNLINKTLDDDICLTISSSFCINMHGKKALSRNL